MAENSKYKYVYFFILLLYIVLVFIVGYNHEPWADEAQSWLVSRDNSYFEILKETKYEGHPFVWFFLQKTMIKIFSLIIDPVHLYDYLFILPLFFSAIGVYLFIFKSKFPLWIKAACPFTFYIFYQYGIVARNHCLCLPMLAIVAMFYEKRFKHPYIYMSLLILCANTSAYLFVISCVLILFFIIEIIKDKLYNNKIYIIACCIGIVLLLLSALNMYSTDGYFWEGLNFSPSHLWDRLENIANIYFPSTYSKCSTIIGILLLLLFYWSIMKIYCKDKYQKALFISINLSLYLVYIIIYMVNWHFGYAFITLLFTCWILTDINKIDSIPFKKNWLFYGIFAFVIGYYVFYTVQTSYFDIKNNYSGSKDAANFIKKYNLQDYKINAAGMKTVALQPYFSKNIYNNYDNSTHFAWKNEFVENYEKKGEEKTPVVVIANWDIMLLDKNLNDYFQKMKAEYYKYYFPGEMRGLNYLQGETEDNSYTVYVDKGLAKMLNIEENYTEDK